MRSLSLLALGATTLVLCGCASTLRPDAFATRTPEMRPEAFFAGATHSFGVMESGSGAPTRIFHVQGMGTSMPDGGFRLDQTVAFDGKPPERRTWVMRSTGPHAYKATLSDASGPVTAEAYGNLFHVHYRLKRVAIMEQWLYLQTDWHTVLNEATVTVAGVVVARLSERISRDGGEGASR